MLEEQLGKQRLRLTDDQRRRSDASAAPGIMKAIRELIVEQRLDAQPAVTLLSHAEGFLADHQPNVR